MNPRERKRVLVLTSTYPRYQGDTDPAFIKHLCKRLQRNFELHVVAPHYAGLHKREDEDGITIHRFVYAPEHWETLAYDGGILNRLGEKPLRYLLVPLFILSQFILAEKLCRKYGIDAIHGHWIIPQGLVAVLVRAIHQIPVVITAHGGDLYGVRGKVMRNLKKWIVGRADRLTVVSEGMKETMLSMGIPEDKIAVSPMGVDLRARFKPCAGAQRDRRLLFVGRLVSGKGAAVLLDATERIAKRHPDVHLDIVGDGPERAELEKITRTLRLEDYVTFHGSKRQEEIAGYYQRAVVLVIPSTEPEGLGLVAVEAMGCRCPVVSTDVPGLRDVVKDGVTGLLAQPGSAEDLAVRIEQLLNDEPYAERLAAQGRDYVLSKFDWTEVAQRYQRLIEELATAPIGS